MKSARLNDYLHIRKLLYVAIDHGMFNEPGFLNGIENMHNAISIVALSPDAIQPGTANPTSNLVHTRLSVTDRHCQCLREPTAT